MGLAQARRVEGGHSDGQRFHDPGPGDHIDVDVTSRILVDTYPPGTEADGVCLGGRIGPIAIATD